MNRIDRLKVLKILKGYTVDLVDCLKDYKWVAIDGDGSVWLYTNKPFVTPSIDDLAFFLGGWGTQDSLDLSQYTEVGLLGYDCKEWEDSLIKISDLL
jgi:hypothetical protein